MAGTRLRGLLVATAVACASTGAYVVLSQPAEASPLDASVAAKWLAGELVDGKLAGVGGPDYPDWGLTIDALFALSATGVDPAAVDAVADAVATNVRAYNSYDDWGVPDVRIAGATSKILVAALAAGEDPTAFGGFNLRQETLDLVSTEGDNTGRVRDKGIPEDTSNAFGQSLAVLGLARSGGAPQPVVDFLIKQQCSAGGFRLSPDQFGTPAPTCDLATNPVLDPDSTAMAVQALLAADKSGSAGAKAAADKGITWLVSMQRPDGSFGGSGPTVASNTNSTGLVGQALAAGGRTVEANRAADYVIAQQLTAGGGAAKAEAGAIAYNPDAKADAIANGIAEFGFDQWRRATAQAVLGLAMVPFGELDNTATPPVEPTTTTTTPGATTTTATTTTTTSGTTTSTSTSGSAQPTTEPTAAPVTSTSDALPPAAQGSPRPSGLATTGASVFGLMVAVMVLIGGGAGLLLAARRRAGR